MHRYRVRPSAYVDLGEWRRDDKASASSITIIEDHDGTPTGLIDVNGNEIWREWVGGPFGFITFK